MLSETACAKLNLALHVRRRRADGYHDLETLFAFCEDGDVLTADAADDLSLTIDGPFGEGLENDDSNLVIRAAKALQTAGVTAGARLHLTKNLPIASGIGGGSADAAAALRILARLWNLCESPFHRHPREGGDPAHILAHAETWIPAFAGMTKILAGTKINEIALTLGAVPIFVSALLYIYKSNGYPVEKMSDVMLEFGLLTVGSIVVAFGVWKVRKWGFAMMLIMAAVVVGFDVHHIVVNPKTANIWDFVDFVLVVAAIIFISRKNVRVVYFNPKLRWWEEAPRFKIRVTGKMVFADEFIERPIIDISTSGCLIGVAGMSDIPEVFELQIDHKEIHFRTKARRVRLSRAPLGIGLSYLEMDRRKKSDLKRIIQALKV